MFCGNPSPSVRLTRMTVEQGQASINYTHYGEQEKDGLLTLAQIFTLPCDPGLREKRRERNECSAQRDDR